MVLKESLHELTFASIHDAAVSVGVDHSTAAMAASNVMAGVAGGVLFSGRQGAGKDTIAPAVLAACSIGNAMQCRVSDPIKDEMNTIIDVVTAAASPAQAAALVAEAVDLRADHAAALVQILWSSTRTPAHGLTGRTRTAEIRLALQYHGHEARLETHPGYWVAACYRTLVPLLAQGHIVYLTDGRFPAEVETARNLGLFTVRLSVSREVQNERIRARDGHDPDPASLDHPGERILDDYDGFSLVVDNSGPMQPVVETVADRFRAHLAAR